MNREEQLNRILTQINRRYCSIFFSKLVLIAEDSDLDEPEYIRHYDIECEAVETMADVLATKIKALSVKVFFEIKNYDKNNARKPKKLSKNSSFFAGKSETPKGRFDNVHMRSFASLRIVSDLQ